MKIKTDTLLFTLLLCSLLMINCGSNSKAENELETEEVGQLRFETGDIVYYTGYAEKKDAFILGKFLYEVEYFDTTGENPTAVWIHIEDEVVDIKFTVVEGAWEDASVLTNAKDYATAIADTIFPEDEVRLFICDEEWNIKKGIKPE